MLFGHKNLLFLYGFGGEWYEKKVYKNVSIK